MFQRNSYAVTDPMIDPRVFYQKGTALLVWTPQADQPTAFVVTPKGTFSTPLTGVPEAFRELVGQGGYTAIYAIGYVFL